MAIYCGFFNSNNQDRLYSAEDMTKPYELLVSNGVFATPQGTPSNYLQVYATAPASMNVTVKAGRGIFFDKWFINDADLTLTVDAPNPTLPRIDSVVARVDKSSAVRAGSIIIKKGTPASSPVAPTLENGANGAKEYRLANILVGANVVSLTQAKITDTRGGSECGWVTSLVQQVDTSTLYIQWQTAFDEWFRDVKETLSTATLIRSYNSHYKTTGAAETVIPIQIIQYNRNLDILQVYINGLMLIKDVEYTVNDNSQITLTDDVARGTDIAFVVYKSIDGSDAETVVSQVNALQNLVNVIKITDNTGTVKLRAESGEDVLAKFIAGGRGFHTMYSATGAINSPASGAFRYFGHLTTSTAGAEIAWIFGMQTDGSVYSNYCYSGTWRGWRPLYEKSPAALWIGQQFMNAASTVYPSKPLSECAHGWVLVWSDYDDDTKEKNNYNAVTFCVPKKNASGNNWNGSSFMCMLPVIVREDGTFDFTCKQVYIYDDHITGFASNATGTLNRGVILSAVYEY